MRIAVVFESFFDIYLAASAVEAAVTFQMILG